MTEKAKRKPTATGRPAKRPTGEVRAKVKDKLSKLDEPAETEEASRPKERVNGRGFPIAPPSPRTKLPPDPDKPLCAARRTSGEPCGNWPSRGSNVCPAHGSRAPQVQRRAAQRLMEASDRAAMRLIRLMSDPKVPHNVQLAAARDILDRARLGGTHQVEVQLRRYEQLAESGAIEIRMDLAPADDNIVDAELVYSPEERAALALDPGDAKAPPRARPSRSPSPTNEDAALRPRRPVGGRSKKATTGLTPRQRRTGGAA